MITGELHILQTWQNMLLPPSKHGSQITSDAEPPIKELPQNNYYKYHLKWRLQYVTTNIIEKGWEQNYANEKYLMQNNTANLWSRTKTSIKTSTRAKPVTRVTTK